MRQILAASDAALLGTVIMPRDFIEIAAKDRTTGAIVYERLWSDSYDISAQVVDLSSGSVLSKDFSGAGGLVSAGDGIEMAADLTVQEMTMQFEAYGVDVDRILRLYDAKGAQIIIWRGFLNTSSRQMVGAAETIFVGEIDNVELPTGADGDETYATVTCLSSQELTRSNPDTRSDASQKRRNATDSFFQYAAAVPDWTIWWGQKRATPGVEKPASTPRTTVPHERGDNSRG